MVDRDKVGGEFQASELGGRQGGGQSRGEAFDEEQGGGRGLDSLSPDSDQAEADDHEGDDDEAEAEFNTES